jgi:hypothetical protein
MPNSGMRGNRHPPNAAAVFGTVHINQYLGNAKCRYCVRKAGKICLCWYKSGHSKHARRGTRGPVHRGDLRKPAGLARNRQSQVGLYGT